MNKNLAVILFAGMLKLYPAAFRNAFGAQMLADFEDMRAARAGRWSTYWTVCMLLDLGRGAVWSHFHPLPVKQMAVAGGGSAPASTFDIKQALTTVRKKLPQTVAFCVFAILGGACLGVGMYDPKSLLLFVGGAGALLLAAWHHSKSISAYITEETHNATEQVSKSMWVVVFAVIATVMLNASFFFISELTEKIFLTLAPSSIGDYGPMSSFGVEPTFLMGIASLFLNLSVFPLALHRSTKTIGLNGEIFLFAFLLLAGIGGTVTCIVSGETILAGLHVLIVNIIILQMFKPVVQLRASTQLLLGALPMPILFGFLLALTVDAGLSRKDIDSVGIFQPQIASARDFSKQQVQALVDLRHTGDQERFWERMEQLRQERKLIHSTRLWLWLTDVRPVGWKALMLCRAMAPSKGYDALQCSKMPDADQWIYTRAQAQHIRLPAVGSNTNTNKMNEGAFQTAPTH